MTASESLVLQVTNISPSVTMEQLETLFGFLGTIDEMQVFPKTNTVPVSSKVAFVRFQSNSAVETGQHLSNTVFIDKAILCVAYAEGKIPDESVAMQYVAPAASESESDGHQIPGNVDPNKVEEIKRTIYVGNLDSKTATAEQLLTFFSTCGEVRFVRMAGDETQPTRFAFVEFADTAGVHNALQLNGMLFGDRPIKVNHSNNAIVKPQNKTQETTAKEIEEAMRRVREAQSLISKALEPEVKERKRSRSRSRHRRRRSRSGSRRRRSGSRNRRRRRSRSKSYGRSSSRRSRSRRSRSRSRRHRRSRSRSHKRSRSRKRDRSSSRKKEKSKSRSRSRSPSKKSSRHKKDRKRDRDRDRERDRDNKKRRRRSKSRSSSREGGKKEKDKDSKDDKEKSKTENGKDEVKTNDEKTEDAVQNDVESKSPEKPVVPPDTEKAVATNGDVKMDTSD